MLRVLLFAVLLTLPFGAHAACTGLGGGPEGVAAINKTRAGAGLRALSYSDKLSAQAQKFACDMINKGYFAHRSPSGQTFSTRLKAAGYSGGCGAENIASTGGGGVGQAISQWMGSGPHKRNILGRRYTVAGLAGAQGNGRTVWVFIVGNCK